MYVRIARSLLLATVCSLTLFLAPAFAITLEAAKAEGLVGENRSGYLATVGSQSSEVLSLVQRVNQERREKYQEIANKNGTSLQAVQKLAAEKAIRLTPSGQYVQGPDGSWQRK